MSLTTTALFESPGGHRNLLLPDHAAGDAAVQANQHLIVHGGEGMILDPGGHKVYAKALAESLAQLGSGSLKYIFLSHQDPDIVAALNGWLLSTDAVAWAPALWLRFIPHFGIDKYVIDRLKPIPDEGMYLSLGGAELMILPAHFLHSVGNMHVYDPTSKILYSGDLGASVGSPDGCGAVTDFDAHVPSMRGFHERYMVSSKALRGWTAMVRGLDVQCIAPQHGAYFQGPERVGRFLDWLDTLEVGLDRMADCYRVPPHP